MSSIQWCCVHVHLIFVWRAAVADRSDRLATAGLKIKLFCPPLGILPLWNFPEEPFLLRNTLNFSLLLANIVRCHCSLPHFRSDRDPRKPHQNGTLISPKSIPNSEKQKQLPNTQWVKYVYCPALFYSRGRTCKVQSQHKHSMKKRFSKSVRNTVANMPEARAKGCLPKELLSASLFTSST